MKKYLLGIIIILAVMFVSGCITDSNSDNGSNVTGNDTPPQSLAKNGISIKYPGSWVVATSGSNDSIAAVADPNSKDPITGYSNVNVNIERRPASSSLNAYFNQTYSRLFSDPDFNPISQGEISLGQFNALESSYTENSNGTIKQHRALWIENNGEFYVILFTAPQDDFQNQTKNFDFILSSFKIT